MTTSSQLDRTVIVGASLAGMRCAASLRRQGYEGEIVLLGEEYHPPYQRPPLSKAILTGRFPVERATLRSEISSPFELRLGTRATNLDVNTQMLSLADRSTISYRNLVIACGARPRQLPILPPSETVLYFRTLDDAITLRSRLENSSGTILIIGAGFIGSEIASSARERNWDVTLIDLDPRLMSKILGQAASSVLERKHRDHGVDLRLGCSVEEVEATRRCERTKVHLSDGSVLEVDIVVVGIGVEANTDWLSESSLMLDNGIIADAYGRAEGVDNVCAAGDVASWFHPSYGRHLRFEHFESATNQAQTVASTIASTNPDPLTELPFAWSDQHGSVIQFLGIADPGSTEQLLDFPDDASHGQSFGYYVNNQCRAAVLIDGSSQLAHVKSEIIHNLTTQ